MAAREAARRAAAIAALALLAACGDSDPPEPGPEPSPSSASPSATGTASPTDTTTSPTVAPAAGEAIRLPSLSGAFPEGWLIIERTEGANAAGDPDPATGGFIFVSELEYFGSGDFDEIVANVLKGYKDEKVKPTRGEDREVAGVEGWVIEGAGRGDAEFVYEWGTVYNGMDIHFTFEYFDAPDDPMAVVDSVLASVEWK